MGRCEISLTLHSTENANLKRVGILATQSTVKSAAYTREFKKLNPKAKVIQQAAPLLVSLIEKNDLRSTKPILQNYLRPLLQNKVDAIILACTHYSMLEKQIKTLAKGKMIINQNNIIAFKLKDYLTCHPEIDKKLSKNKSRQFLATKITPPLCHLAKQWFGQNITIRKITY